LATEVKNASAERRNGRTGDMDAHRFGGVSQIEEASWGEERKRRKEI
jgi:hypothetical protein